MSCNNCIQINPIPTCSNQWIISGVSPEHEGSELNVFIKNIATGALITIDSEPVEADGTVLLDAPEELMNHPYSLSFQQDDGELIEITIGEEVGCCLEFSTYPFETDTVTFSNAQCNVD